MTYGNETFVCPEGSPAASNSKNNVKAQVLVVFVTLTDGDRELEYRVPTIHGVMTVVCFECNDTSKCLPLESDPLNPEISMLKNEDIIAIFGKPYTGGSPGAADPDHNCQIPNLDE